LAEIHDNTPCGITTTVVTSDKTIKTGMWGFVSWGKWVKPTEVVGFCGCYVAVCFYLFEITDFEMHVQDIWIPIPFLALPPSLFWSYLWARI
jgi:hypothetical protein